MTPASSVLLLTTLTGFGYGLLAWVGILAAFGLLPTGATLSAGRGRRGACLRQCRP